MYIQDTFTHSVTHSNSHIATHSFTLPHRLHIHMDIWRCMLPHIFTCIYNPTDTHSHSQLSHLHTMVGEANSRESPGLSWPLSWHAWSAGGRGGGHKGMGGMGPSDHPGAIFTGGPTLLWRPPALYTAAASMTSRQALPAPLSETPLCLPSNS